MTYHAAQRTSSEGAVRHQVSTLDLAGGETRRIGTELEIVRRRLLHFTATLAPRLDELALPLLKESARLLEQQTCRIAVIGQIKAGKSSFINALVGQPGLLPTDINPWTAVVTLLDFRARRAANCPAALFTMFSAEEWQSLAEGRGRLRELTEQFVPDFQPSLLKALFDMMRTNAERRLGSQFQSLLGQAHSYPQLSREILEDYISVGHDDPASVNGVSRPHYSDITRTAELFLPEGPFAFPVTLVDTPGTNDPFLVRDEITRRSLEDPDLFIFVISAIQPLTMADISMLRLINGLRKDRILVFINRIDQLEDPIRDGAAIKQAVEARLGREFPALDIPVVLGSAAWSNLSLQGERLDVDAVLANVSREVLVENGLPSTVTLASATMAPKDKLAVASTLHRLAGGPDIVTGINKLMAASGNAATLAQIGSCLVELTRAKELAVRAELNSLRQLIEARRDETASMHDRLRTMRESTAIFESRAERLGQVLVEIEAHLMGIVTAHLGPLHRTLQHLVRSFAADHAQAMEASLRRQTARSQWVCDLLPLRELLEREYVAGCHDLGTELFEIQRELCPHLKYVVQTLLPGHGDDLDDDPQAPPRHRPSVKPLRNSVVLDVGVAWWKAWFAAQPDPADRSRQLKAMIESDFLPIAAELVREAETHFNRHIGFTLEKARAAGETVLDTLRQHNAELIAEFTTREREGVQDVSNDFDRRQRQRAQDLSQIQSELSANLLEMGRLLSTLQSTARTA